MELPSQISGISKMHEDYSNLQELCSDVETLKNEIFILNIKNEIFERYLKKRNPSSLSGIERVMELASMRSSVFSGRGSLPVSVTTSPASSHIGRPSASVAHSSQNLYRICPLFLTDMVCREIDEGRISMDKLNKRFESARFLLETEEENLKVDINKLTEAKVAFEQFIKLNTDKRTGRVFLDKFMRYIENELQNGDQHLRRLKLKTRSLQNEYNRLVSRHEQRLELRERLHPVDLEKIIAENEELQKKYDQKAKLVVDMKKTIGRKGQAKVALKSKLNDVLLQLRGIRNEFRQKQEKYKFTEEKEVENVHELITAEIVNDNMKRLNNTYKSPDAENYLKLQMKLSEARTEREMWERRCRNQGQTISLLEHQVKQLCRPITSNKKPTSVISYRSTLVPSSNSLNSMRQASRTSCGNPHCTPTTPVRRPR